MKNKLIILLLILEFALAAALLGGSYQLYKLSHQAFPESLGLAMEETFTSYAVALEVQRQNFDNAVKRSPIYIATMRNMAKTCYDLQVTAKQLSALSKLSFDGIPVLSKLKPFQGLDAISKDLQMTLPNLIETLNTAADTIEEYNNLSHQQVLVAIDTTIRNLKRSARASSRRICAARNSIQTMSYAGAFMSFGLALNAVITALIYSCLKQQTTKPQIS